VSSQPNATGQPEEGADGHGGVRRWTGLGSMIATLVWDVGLSIGVFYGLRALGTSANAAVLGATVAAAARVAYVAIIPRRFDAFAAFILSVWAVGLLLSFVSGDARFALAKDSLPTGLAGLIFLGTALAGKPMILSVLRRTEGRTPQGRAALDRRWATEPRFRRALIIMTSVWGVGMLAEAIVRIPVIYMLPIDAAAGLSGLMQIACFALLTVYTFVHRTWSARRRTAGKDVPQHI
jgi:hypothetical protein